MYAERLLENTTKTNVKPNARVSDTALLRKEL